MTREEMELATEIQKIKVLCDKAGFEIALVLDDYPIKMVILYGLNPVVAFTYQNDSVSFELRSSYVIPWNLFSKMQKAFRRICLAKMILSFAEQHSLGAESEEE